MYNLEPSIPVSGFFTQAQPRASVQFKFFHAKTQGCNLTALLPSVAATHSIPFFPSRVRGYHDYRG